MLNDHARKLSSFDCDGDCGAEREDGTGVGRMTDPDGVVALLTWSGVDNGILLVATVNAKTEKNDNVNSFSKQDIILLHMSHTYAEIINDRMSHARIIISEPNLTKKKTKLYQ